MFEIIIKLGEKPRLSGWLIGNKVFEIMKINN